MKILKAAATVLIITSFLCTQALATPRKSTIIDSIAAIVNNSIITQIELERALKLKFGKNISKVDDVQKRQVLNKLVDDMLFDQIVAKAKIEISDDDLARAIAGVLHQNQMTLPQLRSELAAKGVTYDEYKSDMEKQIKRIKFVNQIVGPQVKITDQDLRDFYQRNQEEFRGSHSAHIAEIVLPLTNITTQAEFEKIRDEALGIVQKARKGKNFKALAKNYSKGPNAADGGDVGMVNLKDLPPAVSGTVRDLKVGDVSRPILSENSLVIVKLISLPEISADDFDRLRDEIYAALYDERIEETLNSYLLKERQKAFIEIR